MQQARWETPGVGTGLPWGALVLSQGGGPTQPQPTIVMWDCGPGVATASDQEKNPAVWIFV